MLSKKMEKALNDQINAEMASSYLYLAMAADFADRNQMGFAHWMKVQAGEETGHAMRIFGHLIERGSRVTLTALETPQAKWASPLAAFEAALKHEKYITGRINDLVNLAIAEKDHATATFLQWFVSEQVEEEASALDIVQKLKQVADAPSGLFILDRELAQRK